MFEVRFSAGGEYQLTLHGRRITARWPELHAALRTIEDYKEDYRRRTESGGPPFQSLVRYRSEAAGILEEAFPADLIDRLLARDKVRAFVAGWFDHAWRQRASDPIFQGSYPQTAGLMRRWLEVRQELDAIDRGLREQSRDRRMAVFIGPGIVDRRVIGHLLEEPFIAHQVSDYPSCEAYLAGHTVALPAVEQLLVYYDYERGHYRRKELAGFLRGLNQPCRCFF